MVLPIDPIQSQAFSGLLAIDSTGKEAIIWLWTLSRSTRPMELKFCAQVRLVRRYPSPIARTFSIDSIQSQAFLGLLTIGPNGKVAILWLWTFVVVDKADGIEVLRASTIGAS